MDDSESKWDKLLQIKTSGRDALGADAYHHPYEPTDYCVLERLAESGLIGKDDVVLDYGCGKGRVGFFLSYRAKAKTIGIEYDDRIYESALENRKTTISRIKPDFVLTRAEEYEVPPDVNQMRRNRYRQMHSLREAFHAGKAQAGPSRTACLG